MGKINLTLLKGGKNHKKESYRFFKALATKTRLMGVVALKLHWISGENTHFVQWFLLDAEEHGIYDYISIKTSTITETDKYNGQFMGSLGGEIIDLNRREAFYLIKTFAKENKRYKKPLPRPEGYQFILKASLKLRTKEKEILDEKIFEKILQPSQIINLFIMRLVAKDVEGMKFLIDDTSKYINANFDCPLRRAGVLLRNNIKPTIYRDNYIAYSIVEGKSNYYKIKWRVKINSDNNSYSIKDIQMINNEAISPEEVAIEIQKPEFIRLYTIKEAQEKRLTNFDDPNNQLLKYRFSQGTMYVAFRKNNHHLLKYHYHIGDDIKAIYFINHFQQLIVCYYHHDDLKCIEGFLEASLLSGNIVETIATYKKKGSIIYEYAEAEEVDFIDYLNDMEEL